MNLRRMFRRTRPTPAPPRLDEAELAVIRFHNLTPAKWSTLTNPERAEYRNIYWKVRMP